MNLNFSSGDSPGSPFVAASAILLSGEQFLRSPAKLTVSGNEMKIDSTCSEAGFSEQTIETQFT